MSSESSDKSQASESSMASSLKSEKSNSIASSKTSNKTPSSVQTPDFIATTNAWRLKTIVPTEIPDHLESQIIRPFEDLTSISRFAEMEKLLQSTKHSVVDPTCVRNTANWATIEKHHKFDKPEFNAKQTAEDLSTKSPKLAKIMQNIRKLDREDEARYGRKFKHFIFSDIKGAQGAKAAAAALLGEGYNLGYSVRQIGKKIAISVKSPEELRKTKGANFFLLSSISIYGEPLRVSVKKEVLKKFNQRPDNVYGDLVRIIVMDSGFKEGIDLFDIKYVHIFEPQTTMADQKQVIGRGTRTCGQKGLQFNLPTKRMSGFSDDSSPVGWPLYVFKYDLSISQEYRADFHGAESAFQYYLQSKNVDIRILNLASNLEKLAIKGSVDYRLNKPIHQFSADEDAELSRGGGCGCSADNRGVFWGGDDDDADDEENKPRPLVAAEDNLLRKLSADSRPGEKYKAVKKYVKRYFDEYKWPKVKMENLCGYEGPPLDNKIQKSLDMVVVDNNQSSDKHSPVIHRSPTLVPHYGLLTKPQPRRQTSVGGAPNLISLSPTQEFISTYFTAANPIKGMVLWQSVGTGKTCTAIATATRQFEPLGYTILWVTRTTLKNDIWKNMFEMVCHEGIREKVAAGITIPEDMPSRMRLLSKSWGVRPISYKQFSNLVSKNNQYYDQLVKRNGELDPLRKTLIIIDEAHKLYGGGDLSTIERPDMPAFHRALMNSYAVSGKDSVRVMFMTATPITENPLELVKLVNLCKPPENQLPTEFETFADTFLDDNGDFTEIGKKLFLDGIAGHISYLNREGDVRQFARPILREVAVPLVDAKTAKDIADFDVVGASILDEQSENLRVAADEAKLRYDTALEGFTKGNAKKVDSVCDEYREAGDRTACYKIAKKYANRMIKTAKDRSEEWKIKMSELTKQWRDAKKLKSDKFKFVRQTRKDNVAEFDEYKKSAYYKLKECEREWKDVRNFDEFLETLPVFTGARNLEAVVKEELANVEGRLSADIASQQSRIRSYSNLLKTELTPLETQVVRRTIVDAKNKQEKTKRRNAKWLKRMTKRADASIDRLSKFQKTVKTEIRRVIKEQLKEEKAFAKEEKKEQKMAETADVDLTDTFKESLAETKSLVREKMAERMNKTATKEIQKQENARLAQEKKHANATRKQQVALEKENAAKIKADLKLEKARLAQEKKNAANATRKNQAALEKENAAKIKADLKLEKARLAQEKKNAANATRKNKTAKNKTGQNVG